MNFGHVEPRMFMVPNKWLMEDMKLVVPKVPPQLKKIEKPEASQPSDLTFPKDSPCHNLPLFWSTATTWYKEACKTAYWSSNGNQPKNKHGKTYLY